MVEKWFEHRGHINLDKIAAHLDDRACMFREAY